MKSGVDSERTDSDARQEEAVQERDLKVGISAFGSHMLGVGTLIGSLAWLIHGTLLERAGALPCIVAWVLGAVIMLPLALVIAELASIYPAAGGPYVYKLEAFKKIFPHQDASLLGFLSGWLYWIAMMTGLAFMMIGLSDLISMWFFTDGSSSWIAFLISLGMVVVATLINQARVQVGSSVINSLTLFKFFMAFAFCALICFSESASFNNLLVNTTTFEGASFWADVSKVLMLTMVAYSGLEVVSCTSSETDGAEKNVPAAVLKTLISVAVIYISLSVAVAASMTFPGGGGAGLKAVDATCPNVLASLYGNVAGKTMGACVILSIFACSVGAVMSNARISYSMAKNKVFPAIFAYVHPVSGVPSYSLWIQLLFVSVLAFGSRLASETGLTGNAYAFMGEVYGVLYSFLAAMYGVSLLILRCKEPDLERPFRIGRRGNGLAIFVSAVVLLIFSYLCLFCAHWTHQLTGMALLLAGIPIFKLSCRTAGQG